MSKIFNTRKLNDMSNPKFTMAMAMLESFGVPTGAVVKIIPLIKCLDGISENIVTAENGRQGWFYSSGWNNSYHAADYSPKVVVWAVGAHKLRRCNRLTRLARSWLADKETTDTTTARMAARQLVRAE
jgi:hypothetical protein